MFQDTETAFKHKTTFELKKGVILFKSFNFPWLIKYGPRLAEIALSLRLPVKGIIKHTIFSWFCGGESIDDCEPTIAILNANNVGTILDYSVEGAGDYDAFTHTANEIIGTLEKAQKIAGIPFSVFKASGLVNTELLKKRGTTVHFTTEEQRLYSLFEVRFEKICQRAFDLNARIFIDAEESWYQDAIDEIVYKMMVKFNQKEPIIFNTIQLYRHDRLSHLKNQIENNAFFQGYKLVRGAYLEKENKLAQTQGYPTPMQPSKEKTDEDYNNALSYCLDHIDKVSICAGTHNAESCLYLTDLMKTKGIETNHPHIWFGQLMGMSDNISFNLAAENYNVGKYVPYGPIKHVLPYLGRRANENSAMAGQMSRELSLLKTELLRRKKAG